MQQREQKIKLTLYRISVTDILKQGEKKVSNVSRALLCACIAMRFVLQVIYAWLRERIRNLDDEAI